MENKRIAQDRAVSRRIAPYRACRMAHAKFEIEFELAARAAGDCRVSSSSSSSSDDHPELAMRALKIMFANRRESVLQWQAEHIRILHKRLEVDRQWRREDCAQGRRMSQYWAERFYEEMDVANAARSLAYQALAAAEAGEIQQAIHLLACVRRGAL